MKRLLLIGFIFTGLSGCSRLASIPTDPAQTADSWLRIQPAINLRLGAAEIILVQPSSTIFVYLLGITAVVVGLYFFKIRGNHQSRVWWGTALLLWGAGALFAGTSYQAFSYEIKCAGQTVCSWTSWWEIVYLLLSAASVDALLISGSYSGCLGKGRRAVTAYAILNIILYTGLVVTGVLLLNKVLLSFELLLIVTAPSILFMLTLNGSRYYRHRDGLDLALLATWLWLGVIFAAYFTYLVLDITEFYWKRGIWFSENDLLHLGLIGWMLFIGVVVAKRILDRS